MESCLRYVSEAHITDACPGLINIVEQGDENYFTLALSALGEVGGSEEAVSSRATSIALI